MINGTLIHTCVNSNKPLAITLDIQQNEHESFSKIVSLSCCYRPRQALLLL